MKKTLAFVLLLCMVLTATLPMALAEETIQLTVWVGDNYPAITEKMVESFKAAHPDQTFEITIGIESESTCKDTVLTDPEAAADVFTFADDQLAELVNAGALQPVVLNPEDVIAANGEGAVNAATMNDTLYAYPMSASNGYFMYYDSRFFSEEDVTSLNAMAAKAAAAGKQVGMQFGADGGWYLYSFFKAAGLNMYINEDGLTNTCDWNNEVGANVCQAILDLVAGGGFRADSTSNLVSAAADGTVVALVDGTWDSGAIQEAFGEGYACVKLPAFTCGGEELQMASFAGYKLVGVNPFSANVGYAMMLADWLTNEENQTLRFEDQGDGPSNINAAGSEAVAA
ncbi:MAG: extracellular solute-binding protein, partial [Eubacteriales bacterium]|nr:extracellular solute-binding protein [Eubacteriales bacterium]